MSRPTADHSLYDSTWRVRPEVEVQQLEGNQVVVHLGTNRLFELNETAARFWELLADGSRLESILDQMLSEYKVDPDVLRSELEQSLRMLIEEDLVANDARG